jgi:hypothetical protein
MTHQIFSSRLRESQKDSIPLNLHRRHAQSQFSIFSLHDNDSIGLRMSQVGLEILIHHAGPKAVSHSAKGSNKSFALHGSDTTE